MTVAGRRSLLITYSRKGISRLVRVALTRTRGISLDRKSVYEVLGGGGMRATERQCSGYELIAGFSCRLVDRED